MIFQAESDLKNFAESLGKSLSLPAVFELIGDVGAGKTTFTKALARGLGVKEPVTSPTFTISNRYSFRVNEARMHPKDSPKEQLPKTNRGTTPVVAELVHYDFYRLDDPGIMASELAETLRDQNTVVVVEWGDSVSNLLPADRFVLKFKILPDGSRDLDIKYPTKYKGEKL